MKKNYLVLIIIILALVFASACTETKPTNTNTAKPVTNAANLPVTNTNQTNTAKTNTNSVANSANANMKAEKTDEKTHEHKAPHDGTLVAFGEEFAHIELVLDKESGKLTVYALDGEAEKPVRLKQDGMEFEIKTTKDAKPMTIKLDATENGLTGEKIGDTSEFATQSDALKGLANFEATLKAINIRGKDFKNTAFKFPEGNEEEHEHADHKDEKKGGKKEEHKDGHKH